LVYFDDLGLNEATLIADAEKAGIKLFSFSQVLEAGKAIKSEV
jgi:long-chain acyl-CoA synthetase